MGVKLGHFELLDEIGQGGMGTVFRAFDPSLKRNVAIKLLDADFAQDPQFVEEFLREAQCAAAISHAQIVPIHFVGEHEGHYYIVMELLKGRSLSAIVQDGPTTEQAAVKVAINIAEALRAAYANEMIHGDIKPQNIFVTENNGAKLLDFGLAKLANVDVEVSEGVWGSPHYMSPERVGRKAEDFRSDIYSLGATIFEALVARPPFEAENASELAIKRLQEEPPLLRTLNPKISKRTEHIINKMLAKNPLQRYPDYDSLIGDLRKAEAFLEKKGRPATDASDMFRATGQIAATGKSPRPFIILALLVVILAGGVVAVVMMQKKNSAQVITAVPTPVPRATPQLAASAPPATPQVAVSAPPATPQVAASAPPATPQVAASAPPATPQVAASMPPATPQVAASMPSATPQLASTPAPAPMGFNLSALAASPGDWPQTIILAQAVIFPAIIDGKTVGEVKANPGTPVKLVNMEAGQLVVEFQGGAQRVPVDATNLVQSVEAALGQKYDTLPLPARDR